MAHELTCSEEPWINCTVCSILCFKTDGERLIHEKICNGNVEPIMLRATRPTKEDDGEDDDTMNMDAPSNDTMNVG